MPKGVLLDLSGVLYSGGAAIPGAAPALARLSQAGLPVRFVTNTTSKPRRALLAQLAGFGFKIPAEALFAPAQAAVARCRAEGWCPHLLVAPALEEEFAAYPTSGARAVVLGDAGEGFTYVALNTAFRHLVDGAPFLALAANRTFRDEDGLLSLDAGAFVRALEYASGTTAEVLGKPAPAFYAAAAASMGCDLSEVAMVGDDSEADVAGALAAGVGKAVLVQTGKYRPGDEARFTPPPTQVVPDVGAAIDWLLARAA